MKTVWRRAAGFGIFMFLVFPPLTAHAGGKLEAKLAGIDFPPMSIHGPRSSVGGMGAEIAHEIAKSADIELKDFPIVVKDVIPVSTQEVAIFPMVTRIPERDRAFKWIGSYLKDHYCFVTLKESKPVLSIEEAKTLKSIGVNQGGATEASLRKKGFTNLNGALGALGSLRKLKAGVIEAWYVNEVVARHALKDEGMDPQSVACSGHFDEVEQWLAASLKMPDARYQALVKAYLELEKKGGVRAIVEKYK